MPAAPAFYQRPETIDDLIDQTVNRVLDLADVELRRDLFPRWTGVQPPAPNLRQEPELLRPVH